MDIFSTLLFLQTELTEREKKEVSRRLMLCVFYLCRSPLWEDFVRDPLFRSLLLFGRIPLIGWFGPMITDWLKDGIPHFYVSPN